MKYFLLGIGLSDLKGISYEDAGKQLRYTVDCAFAALEERISEHILISVSPDLIMLAYHDPTPNRALQILECMKSTLESSKSSQINIVPIRAVLAFGDLRVVNVLDICDNFEGLPPIKVARILPKIPDGALALDQSVWEFSIIERSLGEDICIQGKDKDESYNVRIHRNIVFPVPDKTPAKLSFKEATGNGNANEKAIRVAEEIINSSIRDSTCILPGPSGWADVIEQKASTSDVMEYSGPLGSTRADFIRYLLGHLVVNPQEWAKNDALLKTYLYAVEASSDLLSIDDNFVNKSPANAERFIFDLIGRSKAARARLFKKREAPDAGQSSLGDRELLVILHGERGVGKTFLLNHLLTKFSPVFDKHQILWVRLNIPEEFSKASKGGQLENILVHRLLAQTAKVVFRYYDPQSDYYNKNNPKPYPLSLRSSLMEFIESSHHFDGQNREYYKSKLVTMSHAFGTRGVDPPITPELVPEILGRELLRQIMLQEYSIICVLDGLDRIEASAYHRNLFRSLMENAAKLSSSAGTYGIAILAVTRTNTLTTLPEVMANPNAFTNGQSPTWRVYSVPIAAIAKRRVEYIQEIVPKNAQNAGWITADWPHHLQRFQRFLENRLSETGSSIDLPIFGRNNRAKTQILQLMYYDFLKATGDQPYLFVESLVLAGKQFPPALYSYEVTSKGNMKEKFAGAGAFDTQLLPSVFRFPYIDWKRRSFVKEQIPHKYGSLWGLRLLQILHASDKLCAMESSDRLTAKEMAMVLQQVFEYPMRETMYLIDEMAQGELIFIGGYDSQIHSGLEKFHLGVLPKGEHILRHFMYEIAYINLCAMRIPVSTLTSETEFKYFKLASLKARSTSGASWNLDISEQIVRFVTAKIINGIALLRLADLLNMEQRKKYETKSAKVSLLQKRILSHAYDGDQEILGMFEFTRQLRSRIVVQIKGIVQSIGELDTRAVEIITKEMSAYWSWWKDK